MITQIEAVYKEGIFLPLTKPELSEGQIVSIILQIPDKKDTDDMQSKQAVRRSQEIVRKYIPSGLNLAENLIRERRKDSEDE